MGRPPRQDLYRIDDVLLRAGGGLLLLAVAAAGLVVLSGLASGSVDGRDAGLAALSQHAPALALALACPVALLAAGVMLRRRERRIAAVFSLLKKNAVVGVPGLLANSDFVREDLDRAVRFLNNRGLGHYHWDHRNDMILDARLRSKELHVEKCDECGASVSLQVPILFGEVPKCPFCHGPVSTESLEARRREAVERLRSEGRASAEGSRATGSPFSLGLFCVLLFVFWPAAVVYAWLKWQSGR